METKKITLATLKKFIREHKELYVNHKSDFDGMCDCVMPLDGGFQKVEKDERDYTSKNNLGIKGIWLVGSSRDYLTAYEDETFIGISIYNCCGSSILAYKK